MAKQPPKQKPNYTGSLLMFIGSIAFVFVVFQIWGTPPAWLSGGISASLPALVLGIIAATAVVSSIAYLLATLGSCIMVKSDNEDRNMRMTRWTQKMGTWSAFTLLVLTLPGPLSWVVLIGLVLSLIGSAMSMM